MMRKILSIVAMILMGLSLSAQTRITVSGTVLDENGQPLPGLTVLVENSTNGTITDADGKYSLKVNDNSVLVFDCMGYKQHKELVKKRLLRL
jgi:predicted acetyltransferase